MWRRGGKYDEDMEVVAQRLRDERPEASPLELDRAKTGVMARARLSGGGRSGARRLVVAGLTVGMMLAGTGSVLAAGGGNTATGDAAVAQYSTTVTTTATSTIVGATVTVTVTTTATRTTASGGVLAEKVVVQPKRASKRNFSIHFFAAHGRRLKKLTVKVNGKVVKVLRGKKATTNIDFIGVPCSKTKMVVELIGVLRDGKTIRETRHYNTCQP